VLTAACKSLRNWTIQPHKFHQRAYCSLQQSVQLDHTTPQIPLACLLQPATVCATGPYNPSPHASTMLRSILILSLSAPRSSMTLPPSYLIMHKISRPHFRRCYSSLSSAATQEQP
jgi:hypothetical protein